MIINKAGKGRPTVIQDTESYIQEATQHLENTNLYKKLLVNLVMEYNTIINTATDTYLHK